MLLRIAQENCTQVVVLAYGLFVFFLITTIFVSAKKVRSAIMTRTEELKSKK